MLKKFKAFCGKPITYGAYFKYCGVILGVYAVAAGLVLAKNAYDQKKLYEDIYGADKNNEQDET